MKYEVSWLIAVEAASPQEAATAAWCKIRALDCCPVSIVQPMRDDLLRVGCPVLVEDLQPGAWLPGYSLPELQRLQAAYDDAILKRKQGETTCRSRPNLSP